MLTIHYDEITDFSQLEDWELDLIEKAKEALKGSYSPYSHFKVGASVLLENNQIVTGSNQENGAYPSGLCAERVALFYAGANFPGVPIRAIAIVASGEDGLTQNPISPCGACRQVMLEYQTIGAKPYRILMVGKSKVIRIDDASLLLPFSFTNVRDASK